MSGLGSFGRHVPNAAENDPLNLRLIGGNLDELPLHERLTAEEIKAAALLAQREDQATQDRIETQKNGDAFIAGTPAFIDNTANAHLLLNQARTMFGDGVITVSQFQSAYESLRTRTKFLKLDPKELAKEQQAAAKQRFDAAQNPTTPSEQDLYDMPLEDLRRLDAVENHNRMQVAGERDGNGW